jgi:WD40 repeat protein
MRAFLQSDPKIILKLILIVIANMVFMPWVANIYADGCNSLGSGLRINISGMDESWLFRWSASGIEKQKGVYSGEEFYKRLNIYKGPGDKRSGELPQNLISAGTRFDVPFAVSHNGQMLISSIYPDRIVLIPSNRFAIIDLKSGKLLRVIETGDYVRSLAWSPTDKYFAALIGQDVTSQKWKSPMDWIAKFLGHPRQYNTLYVGIYNLGGEMLCRRLLIEKVEQGSGYIDWE